MKWIFIFFIFFDVGILDCTENGGVEGSFTNLSEEISTRRYCYKCISRLPGFSYSQYQTLCQVNFHQTAYPVSIHSAEENDFIYYSVGGVNKVIGYRCGEINYPDGTKQEYENYDTDCTTIGVCTKLGTSDSGWDSVVSCPNLMSVSGYCCKYEICTLDTCETFTCNGIDQSFAFACGEHGYCNATDECVCYSGWTGDNCDVETCNTPICNNRGNCIGVDMCTCFDGSVGDICEHPVCNGIPNNDSNVCTGHGNCIWNGGVIQNYCDCFNRYDKLTNQDCAKWECDGISRLDGSVCSGHGTCYEYNNCVCDNGNYAGAFCSMWSCDGIPHSSNDVCSSHGICSDHDTCMCSSGYFNGVYGICEEFTCNNIRRNNQSSCGVHGECIDLNVCQCEEEWDGFDCNTPRCSYIPATEVKLVCNFGMGKCIAPNNCSCVVDYYGQFCGEKIEGAYFDEVNEADMNNIEIVYVDYTVRISSMNPLYMNDFPCSYVVKNYQFFGDDAKCIFETDVTLIDADYTKHLKIQCAKNASVSVNDIVIISPLTDIEDVNNVQLFIIGRTFSSGLDIVAIVTLSILGVICFFIVSLLLFFIILFIVVYFTSIKINKQRKELKKFDDLGDVNLLLKEINDENDSSIAHLRINKSLFEVDFKDIEVKKKIGSGGSQSVIFYGIYKNIEVAFKCFRTIDVCTTQEKFEEFEKEVQILASVSHPHILMFYGASLKHPRIGIVCEYCHNGDMKQFLIKYYQENKQSLDMEEKLGFLYEIATAMSYIHSKNIIHRDLKCENVLITKNLETKLMDFGLSKVVEDLSLSKTRKVGTSVYMAPEVVLGKQYNEKCDVFSYGIIAWEVINDNFNPYGMKNNFNVENKVANEPNFRPIIKSYKFKNCNFMVKVIKKCWNHHPENRCNFDEIVEYFKSGNDDSFEKSGIKRKSNVKRNYQKEVEKFMEKLKEKNKELKKIKQQLEKMKIQMEKKK